MARRKARPAELEAVQAYLQGVAKNLVDRLYGPEGPAWGTTLTQLEDMVLAVREALSEKMLHQALQRQADGAEARPAAYQPCPGCGRGVALEEEPEPRLVQTLAGEAAWQEPEGYCPKCRQSFFPSIAKPGD